MHRCGRCLSVSYCSQACADNNWGKHKEECVEVKDGGRRGKKNRRKASDSSITKNEPAGLNNEADNDTKCRTFIESEEFVKALYTNSLDEVD